jgi:putative addiction module component (TIGR02574 family)
MSTQLEEALKLPIPERIKLVEEIWDSIAAEHDAQIELSPEQIAELERRIEHSRLHPEDTIPWEVVRDRALARK